MCTCRVEISACPSQHSAVSGSNGMQFLPWFFEMVRCCVRRIEIVDKAWVQIVDCDCTGDTTPLSYNHCWCCIVVRKGGSVNDWFLIDWQPEWVTHMYIKQTTFFFLSLQFTAVGLFTIIPLELKLSLLRIRTFTVREGKYVWVRLVH